jgi:hypothetical protein
VTGTVGWKSEYLEQSTGPVQSLARSP